MQNDVEKKEGIVVFLRIDIGFPRKIFPWLAEKTEVLGFWNSWNPDLSS